MVWEVSTAKNGEATLSLNGVQLYSRYRPREDARKWVESEFDATQSAYLLIGLGLGYHAERLIELAEGKPVYVYYFEEQEYTFSPIPEAVSDISQLDLSNIQILIPNSLMKAIGQHHPLLPYLEDIKINQTTYKKFASLMEENFKENKQLNDFEKCYPEKNKPIACLVASGPSLNKTIFALKDIQQDVDIYAVGSSLKMLLAHGINPRAVIISDPKNNIVHQLQGTNYKGDLYYLSTANYKAVKVHKGERYLLLQVGYQMAEELANQRNLPTMETGGSVSTVAISLLDYMNYEKIILFGQDLGFSQNKTHASGSTSGRTFSRDLNFKEVKANDGSFIYTTPNLQTYARWIEKKANRMKSKLYTTAKQGLSLPSVQFVLPSDLKKLLK